MSLYVWRLGGSMIPGTRAPPWKPRASGNAARLPFSRVSTVYSYVPNYTPIADLEEGSLDELCYEHASDASPNVKCRNEIHETRGRSSGFHPPRLFRRLDYHSRHSRVGLRDSLSCPANLGHRRDTRDRLPRGRHGQHLPRRRWVGRDRNPRRVGLGRPFPARSKG